MFEKILGVVAAVVCVICLSLEIWMTYDAYKDSQTKYTLKYYLGSNSIKDNKNIMFEQKDNKNDSIFKANNIVNNCSYE